MGDLHAFCMGCRWVEGGDEIVGVLWDTVCARGRGICVVVIEERKNDPDKSNDDGADDHRWIGAGHGELMAR